MTNKEGIEMSESSTERDSGVEQKEPSEAVHQGVCKLNLKFNL